MNEEFVVSQKKSSNSILIGIMLLLLACAIFLYMKDNKPKAAFRPDSQVKPVNFKVDVAQISTQDYSPIVKAYGEVEAKTKSQIVSQVSGVVKSINPSISKGFYFSKNDEFLRIDDRDYLIAQSSAQAQLSSANSEFLLEKARSDKAKTDWQKIGLGKKPNDLVLRKPQLLSAKASVDAATAQLEQAKLNIERTRVNAPYNGFLIDSFVDVGQFVGIGTPLFEIYQDDDAQISIPLNSVQLSLLDEQDLSVNKVIVTAELGDKKITWNAKVQTIGAEYDQNTRHVDVIISIEKPFSKENQEPLKIGQFVKAEIYGKAYKDVYRVPANVIYQNEYLYVVNNEMLEKRIISVIFQEDEFVIVRSEAPIKQSIVITPVGENKEGIKVVTSQSDVNKKESRQ